MRQLNYSSIMMESSCVSSRSSFCGLGFVMFYVDISYHLNYPSLCIFPNDRNLRHNTHIDREEKIDFGFHKLL